MRASSAYAVLALVLGLTARVEPIERVHPAHRDECRALAHRATVTSVKRIEAATPDARGRVYAASAALPPRGLVLDEPDRVGLAAGASDPESRAGTARTVVRGARAPPPG